MAFLLYEKERHATGISVYRQVHSVTLAGSGLIRSACDRFLCDRNVGWMISARDMLTSGRHDPDRHALLIDTAPSRKTVSLVEIRSISGYSYADWTPLMLTFDQLFTDWEASSGVETMKREFDDRDCPRHVVRDFLYLMGGYAGGTWNWGGNSRTTAALLWPDAWSFFQEQAARDG